MSNQPNFELLKDAYQIIGGIPEDRFDLSLVLHSGGPDNPCGSIACAAGWLGMHPQFQALGYSIDQSGWPHLRGEAFDYSAAMGEIFGMKRNDAHALFCPRECSHYDRPSSQTRHLNDRDLWLHRVREYLRRHGQLKEQA